MRKKEKILYYACLVSGMLALLNTIYIGITFLFFLCVPATLFLVVPLSLLSIIVGIILLVKGIGKKKWIIISMVVAALSMLVSIGILLYTLFMVVREVGTAFEDFRYIPL